MRLFIVQHGDAVTKDIDPDRPLSDQGRSDVKRLLEYLADRDTHIGQIFHSGKTRARETAEILRPLLASGSEVHQRDGLAPNDPPGSFLDQIVESGTDTLVASHMPFVTRVISQALTGDPDRGIAQFVPGSIAGIEPADDGSWRLIMFVRP